MSQRLLGPMLSVAAMGFTALLSASTGCAGGAPECDAYCACPENPCATGRPTGDKSEDTCRNARLGLQQNSLCLGTDGGGDARDSTDAGKDGGGTMCTAALDQMLKPIAQVSTGTVSVLSDVAGVKTVYVDATAGNIGVQDTYPRVYVRLDTGARVDVDDKAARTSPDWDLAFKRPIIFTNGGVVSTGQGGAAGVAKTFDQVTSADIPGTFPVEALVDKDCNPQTDATGAPKTTFTDWYVYNMMLVTPKPNWTYVVKGGSGKVYKVGILTYYGTPQGGLSGGNSAQYIIKVAAL